tara:strand:- start:4266 stop:4694 length:429 start_codon:yes stop_codon:yes gene_type:complete
MVGKTSVIGIYQIKNIVTGESYIGESDSIISRLKDHMTHLARGHHINKLLQRSWDKYGANNHIIKILEVLDDTDRLSEREIFWINATDALENGFNTQTDQYKQRTLMKIDPNTKIELERLEMGSMNKALRQLMKYYKKFHDK